MADADQILTAGVSVLVGYGGKMAQDWWTARRARQQADRALWSLHKQQFHLPLLGSARELETRLSELAAVYRGSSQGAFSAESLSRVFREVYLLRPDELPDQDGALLAADGDQPRRDDRAVQHLRKRMCYELNFATSSLYRTARYLAHARLVHQHLSGGASSLAPVDQEGLDRLIAEVGTGLQGATRAGIFLEQQESIAEMMVDADGRVCPTSTSGAGSSRSRGGSSSPPCSCSSSPSATSPTGRMGGPASPPSCPTRSRPPPPPWPGWRRGWPRSAAGARAAGPDPGSAVRGPAGAQLHAAARSSSARWVEGRTSPLEEAVVVEGEESFPKLRQVVLDGTDARVLAEFYRRLLGLRYRAGDEPPPAGQPDPQGADWLVLRDPGGGTQVAFQQVAALPTVTWPEGPVAQQLHLDLTVPSTEELDVQHERAMALGARLLEDDADDPEEPLRVYADPAGHPFCIFVARPA
jgi:hypothetical protein